MRLDARRALFTLAFGVLGAGCRPAPRAVLVPPVPRLEQVLPVDFPAVAQAARVSGVVDIEVDVLADGSVRGDTVRVVRGVPLLDQAAIDAARRARFRCDACGVDGATSRLRFDFRADQAGIADRVDWLADGIRIVVFAKALVLQPAGQPAGAATSPALRLRAPIYPQIAQSARVEGGVTVDVEVQPDGSISAARVTRDIPLLSAAVLDALRQSASSCTDCTTPVRRTLVYDFRLTDEPAKPPLDAGDHVVIEITARPPLVMPRMAASTNPPPTIAAPRPVPDPTPRLVPLWIARPAYPSIPRLAKIQGVVIVDVEVAADGSVASATVTRSIPLLDQAALDALKETYFVCQHCSAAPVHQVIAYAFTLGDEEPTFEIRPDQIVMGITAPVPPMMPRLARR